MAEAFIVLALETMNSLTGNGIGRVLGVNKDMEKFSSLLSAICAVLEDAEKKQFTDLAIKDWLQKLNDVSYELGDLLDDCESKAYRLQNHKWTRKMRSSSNVKFRIKIVNKMKQISGRLQNHKWTRNVRSSLNVKFRIKIANKMKHISGRLDEIANEKMQLHLQVSTGQETRRISQVGECQRSSSSIPEIHVYGREDDKERVIGFLLDDAAKSRDLLVFAIVGLGGLGKTTLAKLVYNDERITKSFEIKMWVCVSEYFDLKRLVKEIIESATNTGCEELRMDTLQKRLQQVLRGKRFFLVLDDIWNEDQDEWEKLRDLLACGSKDSSIIVTTRLKTPALFMGTIPMYDLSSLSEEDCWSLFKQRALGSNEEEKPNLVKIGKEIVKKCKGVPLAAKSLGGLLFFKEEEREWLSILHSELWNLPEEKVKILPELRLSYFQLPVQHRRCFAYCAFFPKDYEINKQQLIHLWMANQLICSKGGLEIEDIGQRIFDELCWVSFMQEEKDKYGNISHFKMHSLVHDLAQSIMKEECRYVQVGEDKSLVIFSKRVRHVMISSEGYKGINISDGQSLRTLLNINLSGGTLDSFKFHSLRAFKTFTRQIKLISWIGNMKHLRYLDLSHSVIEILPESICSLDHLLTLDLRVCRRLCKLPKRLNCLLKLRHLYIEGCSKLSSIPPSIGRLTNLKILCKYWVSRNKGCGLDELGHLDLKGSLEIRNLEKVRSPTEAKSSNLSEKKNLKELCLYWSWSPEIENKLQEIAKHVLEALLPPPTLSALSIGCYKGISFPYWMSNKFLGNVTKIKLADCENCVELSSLGTLASLHYLFISGMNNVQYMDNQLYYGQQKSCFVQLRELHLLFMPNLEKLWREEGREMFPCLSILSVIGCPKLIFPYLASVKQLQVEDGTEVLLRSIRNLCGLTSLDLWCSSITCFSGEILENLNALQSLRISKFIELQELSSDMLIGCTNLKKLEFRNCPNLRSLSDSFGELTALERLELQDCSKLEGFPQLKHLSSLRYFYLTGNYDSKTIPFLGDVLEAFQHLHSLESITIDNCKELTSLPDCISNLQSLRELNFYRCQELERIPASFKGLTNLEKLDIRGCPKVKEVGEDWDNIAHIPRVQLENVCL